MKQYTPYGVQVRVALLGRGQTISQLAEQVRERTGLSTDSQYLYKIFTGSRNSERIVSAIDDILGLNHSTNGG